jgi:hypothetical protein
MPGGPGGLYQPQIAQMSWPTVNGNYGAYSKKVKYS